MLSRAGYVLIALAAVATAAAAVVLPSEHSRGERPALVLTAKRGSELGLQTSSTGDPILTAPGLVPGATATGQVQVRNTGASTLALKLVRRHLVDVPGPNGGKLSDALQVQILQVRRRHRLDKPRTAFAGSVTHLREIRLRKLKPHVKRSYQFVVSMPDSGLPSSRSGGDNAYQGASASVDFVWQALPNG